MKIKLTMRFWNMTRMYVLLKMNIWNILSALENMVRAPYLGQEVPRLDYPRWHNVLTVLLSSGYIFTHIRIACG